MLLLASPTGLLAPVQPSVLNEGDRVRVLWGPGEMHDAMVTDRRTELRKRRRSGDRAAQEVSVRQAQVQYDDGDKAWLADGDGWTIWRLSAAAAPLDDDAPPARRRRRRQGRAPPAAAADDDDAPPAAADDDAPPAAAADDAVKQPPAPPRSGPRMKYTIDRRKLPFVCFLGSRLATSKPLRQRVKKPPAPRRRGPPPVLCYCDRPAAQLDGRWVCAQLVEGDFCILGREND